MVRRQNGERLIEAGPIRRRKRSTFLQILVLRSHSGCFGYHKTLLLGDLRFIVAWKRYWENSGDRRSVAMVSDALAIQYVPVDLREK